MITIYLPRKNRAGLIGIATDGDHRFDVLRQKLIHVFGVVSGNIDPYLAHCRDSLGVYIPGGFRAGTLHVQDIASCSAQNSFGEMTPAGIAGAKYQNGRFLGLHTFSYNTLKDEASLTAETKYFRSSEPKRHRHLLQGTPYV